MCLFSYFASIAVCQVALPQVGSVVAEERDAPSTLPTVRNPRELDSPVSFGDGEYVPPAAEAVDVGLPSVGSPPRKELLTIPLQMGNQPDTALEVTCDGRTATIFARQVDVRVVLADLAKQSGINIIVGKDVAGTVTTTLKRVPLWDALDAILKINGLVWVNQGDIIFVTSPGNEGEVKGKNQSLPGQQLQVFDLHYTSSKEVLAVVSGLLSPAGKAFEHVVDKTSVRQTRERIVVEDYPERIHAVSTYIASVDNPPQQVLIEASILQVTLDESQRHGVNMKGLVRMAGSHFNVQAQGFADPEVAPGFKVGLEEGHDLGGVIEALQTQSNVRTLASPKVLIVNGQEARIQIGSKFGYFVTTTTQTSTLQSVDFLDIGVVLQVTPTITRDGQVMLFVEPKVSGGRINADSGLPEEETTEASTTVILPDGKGMIIGGLIKESDDRKNSTVPWFGKLPLIGRFFSRKSDTSQRVEVIIALTPHIVPYSPLLESRELADFNSAVTPQGIINGHLPGPSDYAGGDYAGGYHLALPPEEFETIQQFDSQHNLPSVQTEQLPMQGSSRTPQLPSDVATVPDSYFFP
ncbi:hypothetical protein [Aureliella helgolandensis]|uniref:Type IV pilus biogenesis and competence protein PilQ n=1 Tax=Aureliella helgolandensis TaxID=2527968 RepID=A0A518GHQ5_9BACT|nr:hypothetical protein [Aureliella helgolandensis]QDV28123.1 Type IV pilus biogenesis and competence protein PilQ precursor [Aureliella helgolandensis]